MAVSQSKYNMATPNHDQYLIYNINEEPPIVLTTSCEKIQTACQLSGYGDEIWPTDAPYAHIDFQPSRVCGMSTLGVQFFIQPSRSQLPCSSYIARRNLHPLWNMVLPNTRGYVFLAKTNAQNLTHKGGWAMSRGQYWLHLKEFMVNKFIQNWQLVSIILQCL